jgi:uncharacterized membrane protein
MENKKILLTIISAAFLGIITFLAIIPFINAATNNYGVCSSYGMMNGLYGGYGITYMIISWIIMILIIVLILAAIYWLIRSANKKNK